MSTERKHEKGGSPKSKDRSANDPHSLRSKRPQSRRSLVPLPSFIYAGAAKSGSTWLYEVLREHPQVFVPEAKDIYFFDKSYDKGLDWYLDHFREASCAKASGELSHDYFLSEETARRIRQDLPGVRLIFCLRERVDFAFSRYLYDKTIFEFFPPSQYKRGFGFDEFARHPTIEKQSDYLGNLRPFFDLFARGQLLVLFYDELKSDPEGFARKVYEFIGVDADFEPPSLHRKVNVARASRSATLTHWANLLVKALRRGGQANLVGKVKHQGWLQKLFFRDLDKPSERPRPDPAEAAALHEYYHRDDAALEALLGTPLPEAWKTSAFS